MSANEGARGSEAANKGADPALRRGVILALDPVGGISGDMCLAALLHLGDRLGKGELFRAALRDGLRALVDAAEDDASDLSSVQLRETQVEVNGVCALHVEVALGEEIAARQPPHRPWREIRELLTRAKLPELARKNALAVFAALADAEGRVHGVAPEEVEFHEVGGLDSIVDIAGTALLIGALSDAFGPVQMISLPPPMGGGIGRSAHGVIPLPAPATLELLRGRAVRQSGPGERTTPTGAALAVALSEPRPFLPDMTLLATGTGAGLKRWDDAPNLLRAVLGEPVRGGAQKDAGAEILWQLEANIDDLSPQLFPVALEALFAAGAKDAWIAPIAMKKGRPGHLLGALVAEGAREACEQIFFRETSSLGVRAFRVERRALEREIIEVQTRYGPLRIKLGKQQGVVLQAAPELEDCLAAARAHGVPAKEVIAEALAVYRGK